MLALFLISGQMQDVEALWRSRIDLIGQVEVSISKFIRGNRCPLVQRQGQIGGAQQDILRTRGTI